MMINFAGKKVSKLKIANETPRSSDPNKGFIGSPYKEYPEGYWVAPGGLKCVVKKYLGKAKIMTGYGRPKPICYHVGIYLGNNKVLHSWPNAGVTVWNANFRPYYYAKRVFPVTKTVKVHQMS